MGWRTIYVSQHVKISTLSRQLVIQTSATISRVPIEDVQVLILGTPQVVVSGSVVSALAHAGAKIIFTGITGQIEAETMGISASGRSEATIRQQVSWGDTQVAALWTKIVQSKIQNQAQVLHYFGLDDRTILDELDALELNDLTNREAVAARKYFPKLFGPGFSRNNLDAQNAALNYGYAILLSAINREITALGYLTEIGIHHHNTENKYNLGSDLMEPFRPIIDQWVAGHKFTELTPDIKIGLVQLLDVEIEFNRHHGILRTVIAEYTRNALKYLCEDSNVMTIEVVIPNEVSSDALNSHV